MVRLLYQGHGSLRLTTNNTVIFIDPYAGDGYSLPADIVLITHEHRDHNDLSKIKQAINCVICRSSDMFVDNVYQSKTIHDVSIKAVPAYNDFHKNLCCVGYIVKVEEITIYFAGDTSMTEYMKQKMPNENIDYAFLPTDGIYNMGVEEAIECADLINAIYTIPIHMKPGSLFDEDIFETFHTSSTLFIRPGEEIQLVKHS